MLFKSISRAAFPSLRSSHPNFNKFTGILNKKWGNCSPSYFMSSQINPQQNPSNKWPESEIERVSMAFSRCRYKRLIKTACRENGRFPEYNPKLAKIIEESKNCNLSPEAIEFCIKSTEDNRFRMGLHEVFYPGGGLIILQYEAVDVSFVEYAISQVCGDNATLLSQNQRQNYYNPKAVVVLRSKAGEISLDQNDQDIISESTSAEVIETTFDENEKMILTAYYDMSGLLTAKRKLESLNYCIEEAFVGYVPRVSIKLHKKILVKVAGLLEGFSEIREIDRLYENLK